MIHDAAIAPPTRPVLLLVKSGEFAHRGGFALYGNPPRWHKVHAQKPAPKGAPQASHPEAAGQHNPVVLSPDQVEQLKYPAEKADKNAEMKAFNEKHLPKLLAHGAAGDATAILGSGFCTNSHAKKQVAVANFLLGEMGSQHTVAVGQGAGTHAAVQAKQEAVQAAVAHLEQDQKQADIPASEKNEDAKAVQAIKEAPGIDAALQTAKEHMAEDANEGVGGPAEHKHDKAMESKLEAAQGALAMPDFQEGKSATGVVDYYQKVAQKIIDHAQAGNVAVLEDMKASGLKPNSKGKVSNTWAGKTANSKMLLALHAQALEHAGGGKSEDAQSEAKRAPGHISMLNQIPWDKLLLPASNSNAGSHNRQVSKIKAMAYAGDLAGLEAFKAGINTYGKRQKLLAQTAASAIRESSPKLAAVEDAAHESATSPHNDKQTPSEAQQAAGNYQKGHIKVSGLDVTIENPRGSVRSGKRPDGSTWEHKMSDHYGYIKRTTGADGEHVDVYVGPHVESDRVFVVDQVTADGGFDEHKVMLGFSSKEQAVAAYASNFDQGWKVGPVTEMSADEFKGWLKDGDTRKPAADNGPKDGERNADGLVFRNGRWHRDEQPASATADDGLSDDPNSPNYRFRDTGYISGSRKEDAAASIKRAAKSGAMVRSTDIDWEEIERNPREARELIKKSNLFGQVDWDALRDGGMGPSAGFLIDRVYASVAAEPDRDSPQKRKDYALGLESLRDRMERCKTPDEVVEVLKEIRDELEGSMLTEDQSVRYRELMEQYAQKREVARQAKQVYDAIYQDWNHVQNQLNSLEYQQRKRTDRGWKPDADLQKQIESLRVEVEQAHGKFLAYREDHPELQSKTRDLGGGWKNFDNDLEWDATQFRVKADAMMRAIRAENLMNNPVTRAWITLGPKFLAVLNYRRGGGSEAFAGHVTNARRGKITDWSWAENDGATVKKATKREIGFQLKVAEKYERKGGREVAAASTSEFKEKFGLREVQSGNWVLNDPNSAAWHVQKSTEAFADLADILGAKDEQVSMHGRLAMAFGARGRGNAGFGGAARAHYDGVQRVINLTKMGGGGALAHEWAHALDNLIVEAESGKAGKDDFASENPDLLPAGELRDAFKAVRAAMLDGNVQANETLKYSGSDVKMADLNVNRGLGVAQSIKAAGSVQAAVQAVDKHFGDTTNMTPKRKKQVNDWRRLAAAYYDRNPEGGEAIVKAGPGMSSFAAEAAALDGGSKNPYWSQTREMFARAFQSYVEDKLEEGGRRNDYLSAMADNKYYRNPVFGDSKPFPEGDERIRINKAFDKLVAALGKSGTLAKAANLMI